MAEKKKISRRDFMRLSFVTAAGVLKERYFGGTEGVIASSKDQEKVENSVDFQFDLPPGHALVRVSNADSLSKIAQKCGTDTKTLGRLNGLDNPDLIFPGQLLLAPFSREDSQGKEGVVSEEELKNSGELIFLAAPRPDLSQDQDFDLDKLGSINGLREEMNQQLVDLYGPPWTRGLAWVRHPSSEQIEPWRDKHGWDVGGYIGIEDSNGQEVKRVYVMPFEDWKGTDEEEKRIIQEASLIHEEAHVWLWGIEVPPFNTHNIVRLADETWEKKRTPENGTRRTYITPEHYLHLRDPKFFQKLFHRLNEKGVKQLAESETLGLAEEVMPGFSDWWEAYHSSVEVPNRESDGGKFDFREGISAQESMQISWYASVKHVRPLGLAFNEEEEGFFSDTSALPDEDGLYTSFYRVAELPWPQKPDNALAVPWTTSMPKDEWPFDDWPFCSPLPYSILPGDLRMPAGEWTF
jgi:hypothetical protein